MKNMKQIEKMALLNIKSNLKKIHWQQICKQQVNLMLKL